MKEKCAVRGTSYMPIYDHPPLDCSTSSGPSTLLSTVSSVHDEPSTSTFVENTYENIEEYSHLCNYKSEKEHGEERPEIPPHSSRSSTIEKSPARNSQQLNIDFIKNIPPPPLIFDFDKRTIERMNESDYGTHPRSLHSCSSVGRKTIDMRPLSIPIQEMKRRENEVGSLRLVVGLTIATIVVFAIAFSIYYWFNDIEGLYRKITEER